MVPITYYKPKTSRSAKKRENRSQFDLKTSGVHDSIIEHVNYPQLHLGGKVSGALGGATVSGSASAAITFDDHQPRQKPTTGDQSTLGCIK